MAVFNYAGGEINAKIVYYGPGLSGKTTNLEYIYSKLPRENKGKMVSMKTRTDRTLFFDFLPIDVGEINGMKVRFLLYTVPGQVYYNATRKLVLKGVDAVVFVADSAPDRMQDNKESLQNLEDNLNDLGMTLKEIPWVIQFNKRDLPNRLDREVMEKELNSAPVPCFEASASSGKGVYETFEGIAKLVFGNMVEGLKDPDKTRDVREGHRNEHLNVEVIAKSTSERNSETDESDYRCNAEKREEEHKSVSEFLDTVLKEKDHSSEGVSLGATREGYEDYGHVVDLNGSAAEVKKKTGEMEIIPDPASKLTPQVPTEGTRAAEGVETHRDVAEEKTIRVPLHLSKNTMSRGIRLNVVLEIEVDGGPSDCGGMPRKSPAGA
jgi:signal recognition particle receptor subunit beta